MITAETALCATYAPNMPDVSSGLFALGGVAVAEISRGVAGWRGRKHALEDRRHLDQREDDARWLDERRRVHVHFLDVATAWQQDLEQLLHSIENDWADPPDDADAHEADAETAGSALELVAGDQSHRAARAWIDSLSKASIRATLSDIAGEERDYREHVQRMKGHLEKAIERRELYVKAARDELGTTRRSAT